MVPYKCIHFITIIHYIAVFWHNLYTLPSGFCIILSPPPVYTTSVNSMVTTDVREWPFNTDEWGGGDSVSGVEKSEHPSQN